MFGARMRPVSDSESMGCARRSSPCSARRPRLSSNSASLALAARLGEHHADDQQQQCAGNEDPPVVEERVEQRRLFLAGRSVAAGCCSGVVGWRPAVRPAGRRGFRRRRGCFGGGGLRCGRHGLGLRSGLFHCRSLGRGSLAVGAGCCCEAASLACRSASSVLRSSSMRLDSVSWPSSSRTRLCEGVDLGGIAGGRARARCRVARRHQAQASAACRTTRRGPASPPGGALRHSLPTETPRQFLRCPGMRSTEPARRRFMSPSNAPELPR